MNADAVCNAVRARCSELFDGYLVVGFIAGSNQPVIVRHDPNDDPKTIIALNSVLFEAVRPIALPPEAEDVQD